MTAAQLHAALASAWGADAPFSPVVIEEIVRSYPAPHLSLEDPGWVWLLVNGSRVQCWATTEHGMWGCRAYLQGMAAGARELRWAKLEVPA